MTKNSDESPQNQEMSIRSSLSRRGFFGLATATAAAATLSPQFAKLVDAQRRDEESVGGTLAELMTDLTRRCENTKKLFGEYYFKDLFSKVVADRKAFAQIIGATQSGFGMVTQGKLKYLKDTLEAITAQTKSDIHIRHFFVEHPKTWSGDDKKLADLKKAFLDLETDFIISPYYHLVNPDADNLRPRIQDLFDGWYAGDDDKGKPVVAAGLVRTLGGKKVKDIDSLAAPAGQGLWWRSLRNKAIELGILAGRISYVSPRPEETDETAQKVAADQCAVFDGTIWQCVYNPNTKCSLVAGYPSETGCDICMP